jgi:hypothetical protein
VNSTEVLARVKSVTAVRGSVWTLVHRSRYFRIFLDNPAVCRTVHVADYRSGIA